MLSTGLRTPNLSNFNEMFGSLLSKYIKLKNGNYKNTSQKVWLPEASQKNLPNESQTYYLP